MSASTPCPSCSSSLAIPEGASGRKLRCPSCREVLRVFAGPEGGWSLQRVQDLSALAAEGDVSAGAGGGTPSPELESIAELEAPVHAEGRCPSCGAELGEDQGFCSACGTKVGDPSPSTRRSGRTRRHVDQISRDRERSIGRAAKWLIAIAVLFVVGGIIQGLATQQQADQALRQLANDEPDETYVIEGEEITVAELRRQIRTEVTLVWVINMGLAAAMLGLYFWARGSPLPAFMTALGLYLAVVVLNALVEPTTLRKGIAIKILVILALVKGIQAALSPDPDRDPVAERVSTRRGRTGSRPTRR